jgi:hypothetical protein
MFNNVHMYPAQLVFNNSLHLQHFFKETNNLTNNQFELLNKSTVAMSVLFLSYKQFDRNQKDFVQKSSLNF